MHSFQLSVPCRIDESQMANFGFMIALARQCASQLDRVVYISLENAMPGHPNRWAVSPRGYLSVEGVAMPQCKGCGDC